MHEDADQRSRDLECDRRLSAGLCMAATSIAAARHLPRVPSFAGMFRPEGASAALAPIIVLACVLGAAAMFLLAAGAPRRAWAALAIAFGAAAAATAVPFAHQCVGLFFAGAAPAAAGTVTGFAMFGLVASIAADDLRPDGGHLTRSAGLSVVALLMAAVDADGVFACVLAAMGLLFFALGNRRRANA